MRKRLLMVTCVLGGLLTGERAAAQAAAPQAAQASAAQAAPDTAARRAAMARLAFLQGRWSGEASAMVGRGQKLEMIQTESVRYATGGQTMLVEGVGRRIAAGEPRDTLFHAVATIDWLPERGYLMRAYTLAGHYGEFPLTVTERGYVWEMPVPGGKVMYTMGLTADGTWDERGDYVRGDQRYEVIRLLVRPVTAQP